MDAHGDEIRELQQRAAAAFESGRLRKRRSSTAAWSSCGRTATPSISAWAWRTSTCANGRVPAHNLERWRWRRARRRRELERRHRRHRARRLGAGAPAVARCGIDIDPGEGPIEENFGRSACA
jgi:hypothetical protein